MKSALLALGLPALAALAGHASLQPAPALGALPQEDAGSTGTSFLIRAGTVYVGNGQVLRNVLIGVEAGKISGISDDDPQLGNDRFGDNEVIDLRTRTIVPGFVAAHSARAARDSNYNLSPDVRAAENYDLIEPDRTLLKAGVTTVYLSPGNRRLLPGIGSVVKTAGEKPEGRVLSMDAALRINLSQSSRSGVPAVFEPVMSPTSDDPLEPARRQLGTARSSQLDVLAQAFAEARDTAAEYGGEGPAENRYRLDPLREALAGRLPVRLMASSAADIVHGMDFAEGLGLRVVLELPSEADELAGRIANAKVPVVVPMPLRPGKTLMGDFDPEDPRLRLASATQAGALARKSVRVALVPSTEADLAQLRTCAGLASRYGLPRKQALAAITLDAARLLGVEARVGSLEKGKDADLVVLSGSPFDARTQIERVFVDGRTVHESDAAESSVFAIRVARLLRGNGAEEKDALLIVKDGRVYDAGSNASLPPGCKVYEAPGAVAVPGMIDASSQLGLHNDATIGVPGRTTKFPAKTDVDVAAALEAGDDAFALARDAGVTSICVTPDDSGLVGPRVAAVRTGGERDHFVLRELAGLRMTVSKGGPAGEKAILAALDKAKKYFAAKNAPPKKEEQKDEKKEEAAKPDPITGTWTGTVKGPTPQPVPITATLELDGEEVSGNFRTPLIPTTIEVEGTWKAPKLELETTTPIPGAGKLTFEATVQGTKMSGTVKGGPAPASFELTRQSRSTSKTRQAAKDKKRKEEEKKLDENLEPFGPVFAREIPLVVRFSGRDAAQAAVDTIVKKHELRLVLAAKSTNDWVAIAKEPLTLPPGTRIGLLFGVEDLVYRRDKVKVNLAQFLADQKHAGSGYDPILVSRAQTGAMLLPTHAAWAVSEGLDPRNALRAITHNPAAHFGMGEEIGTLELGKSADFVLMDGDPFDLQSRVLGVWIAGKQCFGTWQEIRSALAEVK